MHICSRGITDPGPRSGRIRPDYKHAGSGVATGQKLCLGADPSGRGGGI